MTAERLFDVNGGPIMHPPGFDEAMQAIGKMIDGMEELRIDRSDMRAMLSVLFGEATFQLVFLPPRS